MSSLWDSVPDIELEPTPAPAPQPTRSIERTKPAFPTEGPRPGVTWHDYFEAMRLAFREAWARGYRRPGYAGLVAHPSEEPEPTRMAAFGLEQQRVPRKSRLAPLVCGVGEPARFAPAARPT